MDSDFKPDIRDVAVVERRDVDRRLVNVLAELEYAVMGVILAESVLQAGLHSLWLWSGPSRAFWPSTDLCQYRS